MRRWGKNPKRVPTLLCQCGPKGLAQYRRCHGAGHCCNVSEGLECWAINERPWGSSKRTRSRRAEGTP